MKGLAKSVANYLQVRRGLGFKLERHETCLRQFIAFMERRKRTRITTKLALEFAIQHPQLHPKTQADRLSVVRGFARYRIGSDARTQVPPMDLLPAKSYPARPYLYSQAQILRLLQAAQDYPAGKRFPGPWWRRFRAQALHCICGLMAVSGMRIGEVLNLQPTDIDWSEGLLTVRHGKFGKSRLVPLHASTLQALARYVQCRDRFFTHLRPGTELSHFFVNSRGTRLHRTDLNRIFRDLSRQIGLRAPAARHGPRLHDFRHRFAVVTLLRWYRAGRKVDGLLPVLSTYLGHTHVSGTYWYLRCTPQLMVAAGHRLERRWKGVR